MHSAVVAEWESQLEMGLGKTAATASCTPLSWRSGSLNHYNFTDELERVGCTPLSWRSGSLNRSMVRY